MSGNMTLYIGNLSLEVSEEELRQEFMAFGQVTSVCIMNDKHIGSGQSRGYAFVEMPSKSEGRAAIAGLTGKILKGRPLDVIEARPLSSNRNSELNGGGRAGEVSSRSRRTRY